MELLNFDEIDNRHDNIKMHGRSCQWLLQRQEYLDWRNESKFTEHHGFLWIKGKAGTGKSTMMKYAYAHSRKVLQDDIVISYFFNARGAELEKSMSGMFRSLLYQTLERLRNAESIFELLRSHGYRLRTLNLEVLKEIFQLVIENLGQQRLTCFIDALDETNEDDVQDMVALFEDIGQSAASANTHFHVCYSSRHYPHITIKHCQNLVLEERDEHHANIEKYLKRELAIGHSKLADGIKADIQHRALGIFLWVVLVVEILNKTYRKGSVHLLRERLNELPDKLEDLFRMLIRRDTRNTEQLVLALQWVLLAKRPLKREEFYFAVRGVDQAVTLPWNREETTVEDMERFILDCSKGLVEVTRSARKTVQVIHESVRSFFLQGTGLPELEPLLAGNVAGLSHDKLKQCCQNWLLVPFPEKLKQDIKHYADEAAEDLEELRGKVSSMYPFVQYAAYALLQHADIAQSRSIAQRTFVEDFPLGDWIDLHNLFEKTMIRKHDKSATRAHIFADQRVTHLLEVEIERNADFNADTEGSFRNPIGVAVARGNERDVELLLRKGGNPLSKVSETNTALQLATKKGNANIVRTLLDYGANPLLEDSKTALLVSAVKGGRFGTVKVLLDHRFNANATFRHADCLAKVLEVASAKGQKDIVELLISHGADIDSNEGELGSPLRAACWNGHLDVVRSLLNHHAKCNADGAVHSTPLHVASMSGNQQLVKLLIDKGDDINIDAKDSHLGTPLCLATARCDRVLVELLLSLGANPNVASGPYGTPLQAASHNGFVNIAELLLKNGALVNLEGGVHGSALNAALARGHENVAQLLLDHGGHGEL